MPRRVPLLLAAAAAIFAAVAKGDGQDWRTVALFTVGAIAFGGWMALEAHIYLHGDPDDEEEKGS